MAGANIVDVQRIVTEKIRFTGGDYILNTNDKTLFKMFHKIKDYGDELKKSVIEAFLQDKFKNVNKEYRHEIFVRDMEVFTKTILKYFDEFVENMTEADTLETIDQLKAYDIELESDDEDEEEDEEESREMTYEEKQAALRNNNTNVNDVNNEASA